MLNEGQLSHLVAAASALHKSGSLEMAGQRFAAVLREQPDHIPALKAMADIEHRVGNYRAAAALATRANTIAPDDPMLLFLRGRSLFALRRHDEARKVIETAVWIDPSHGPSWHLLALLHRFRRAWFESLKAFDGAVKFATLYAAPDAENDVRCDRAITLLAMGRYADGLEDYEVRWKQEPHRLPPLAEVIPEWKGESLAGKTVAVVAEQGAGDIIMMTRFVRQLREMAREVIYIVPHEFKRLISKTGIECVTDHQEMSRADYWSPTFSMWRWLGTSISGKPYLPIPRIPAQPAEPYRVGIVWAGGGALKSLPRSFPLESFLGLAEIPGVTLVSLQKGDASDDLRTTGASAFISDDVIRNCEDWCDTAQLVAQMNLVISVDTGIVHLCGALGIPCWVVLDEPCAWQWLADDTMTPWYDSLRLFHVKHSGAIDEVMSRVCGELRTRISHD